MSFKPMKGFKYLDQKQKVSFPAFIQPKLNGIRMIAQAGILASTGGKIWSRAMHSHIREALDFLPHNILLDGECYHHGWSLQKINSAGAVTRNEPTSNTWLLQFHVFDLVDLSAANQMSSFSSRLALRDELLARCRISKSPIKLVETHQINTHLDVGNHHLNFKSQGYEGSMVRTDSPYGFAQLCGNKENRWNCLLKHKDWEDDEFEIVDVKQENSTRGLTRAGCLVCRCDAGLFEVYSGMDDSERNFFWLHPPVGQFATIRFETYSDQGFPLKPQFITIRDV